MLFALVAMQFWCRCYHIASAPQSQDKAPDFHEVLLRLPSKGLLSLSSSSSSRPMGQGIGSYPSEAGNYHHHVLRAKTNAPARDTAVFPFRVLIVIRHKYHHHHHHHSIIITMIITNIIIIIIIITTTINMIITIIIVKL